MKKTTLIYFLFKLIAISTFGILSQLQADVFSLDNDFGNNGHLLYAGSNTSSIYNREVKILNDGKIITLTAYDNAGLITQHLEDGSFDNAFANNGILYLNDTRLSDITVQPDGKIIIIGEANISVSNNSFLIARFLANGTPDYSFGNSGKTIIQNESDLVGGSSQVDMQSDGSIVISGGNLDVVVARFTNNGLPDLAFGNIFTFKAITDFGGRTENIFEMVIDEQDRILVTGISNTNPSTYDTRIIVVRYLPNGELDQSFNDQKVYGGIFLCKLLATCGSRYIYPAFYQDKHIYPKQFIVKKSNADNLANNKIVLTGQFGTARLTENGAFDHTFGNNGLLYDLKGESVAVRNDNKMVFLNLNNTIELRKDNGQLDDNVVNYNCVLDPTINLSIQDYTIDGLSKLVLDSQERIVISGAGHETSQAKSSSVFLARYNDGGCPFKYQYPTYEEYNPFVHPLEPVGPIWGGVLNSKQIIH